MKYWSILSALYLTLVTVTVCLWIVVVACAVGGVWFIVLAYLGPALAGTVGVLGLAWKLWRRKYKV